ncbi:hypothetical protein HAX54_009621 [Datura stramonium]|uniref:ABC transporter family G domain-containing protein n=1 Tax=Datura stramonium TaxID=4076 RepID=A0ABS8TGT5_DATST|nr:hypothetical protein [Datura stramonium]
MAQIGNFCYPKWALEAFLLATARRYSGVWLISRCGLLKTKTMILVTGIMLAIPHPCGHSQPLRGILLFGDVPEKISHLCSLASLLGILAHSW